MTDNEIRKLVQPREFVAAWFRELPKHKTYEAAYEHIDDIYEAYFGKRKYSCYNSFRNVKDRIYKSK
jgi:hypothetical protein